MSANHLKLGIHRKKEIDVSPKKKESKILVLETNKKQKGGC